MKVHELVTGGPNPNHDEWDAYLQLLAFRGMRQQQVIWRSGDKLTSRTQGTKASLTCMSNVGNPAPSESDIFTHS